MLETPPTHLERYRKAASLYFDVIGRDASYYYSTSGVDTGLISFEIHVEALARDKKEKDEKDRILAIVNEALEEMFKTKPERKFTSGFPSSNVEVK